MFCETLTRVMGDSSFLGNHHEGQGQNVLEREDEQMKGRSTNEKTIRLKGGSDGTVEPGHRALKDCGLENYEEKPSHGHLDSLPNGSATRKLVHRDDDENFVRSTQLSSKNKISGDSGPPPDTLKLKDASPFANGNWH